MVERRTKSDSRTALADLFAPPLTSQTDARNQPTVLLSRLQQHTVQAARLGQNDSALVIPENGELPRLGAALPSPKNNAPSLLLGKDDCQSPCRSGNSPMASHSAEDTPLLQNRSVRTLFEKPSPGQTRLVNSADMTPRIGWESRKSKSSKGERTRVDFESGFSASGGKRSTEKTVASAPHLLRRVASVCYEEIVKPSTWTGGILFLLFHIVFSLTVGATIMRPRSQRSVMGVMTKVAALGTMFGAPVYFFNLNDIPALYPTVDLFSAPFLANLAIAIDDVLFNDPNVSDEQNDQVFLGTFSFLVCLSLIISGILSVLASVFKLANLGAFLPFPVICGFFSAVGFLMWSLAFKIDSNGRTVDQVFFSGDTNLIAHCVIHHVPSLLVALIMKYLGPKHPLYVAGLACSTVCIFYVGMFILDLSLQDMIERDWFWSKDDLIYGKMDKTEGFSTLVPPAPFGWINCFVHGKVHFGAVVRGLDTAVAFAFLYVIRCSLHGAALKKNVSNLRRVEKIPEPKLLGYDESNVRVGHQRNFSESVDIEHAAQSNEVEKTAPAKQTTKTLKEILIQYGYSQFVCAAVGGFSAIPAIAASPTMYTLGAERVAPQLLSIFLLSIFYMTDFVLIGYIPKTAFSSLLVLAFIDILNSWLINSFRKTKEKTEWLVVPIIVVFAFLVGLLQAVFLGIAMSTFLFVASFFRSGVVKYVTNCIDIRSTIERPIRNAEWLDKNGDLIQVIVLQNYLFFGNASSILSYIASMFEDLEENIEDALLPPLPKVIVIDLTLVTGMDTSAVDVFSDILGTCMNQDCKLFLSGMSTSLREVLQLGGVKPNVGVNRGLRFFPDLDSAVGKAEDLILGTIFSEDTIHYRESSSSGFAQALQQIDEQHKTDFSTKLRDLEGHTSLIELEPSETLYEDNRLERGLFFIERGVMKIERDASFSLSRASGSEALRQMQNNNNSIGAVNARTCYSGMSVAIRMKDRGSRVRRFRVARVGPGWVLGNREVLSGEINPATTVAVTNCRLHYISYSKIDEIEIEDPTLVLHLYKLLSYLMAKRQEVTIGQLGTLHSIMSAPALTQPTRRYGSHVRHASTLSSFYD